VRSCASWVVLGGWLFDPGMSEKLDFSVIFAVIMTVSNVDGYACDAAIQGAKMSEMGIQAIRSIEQSCEY
jgi:hypothetical protein